MEVIPTREFAKWWGGALAERRKSARHERRAECMVAVYEAITALERAPQVESATFRRVMIAKRYLLWRVRHAHDPSVQVRVIVWFSTNERCHVLLGGDKAGIEELWYVSAAERGERLVDSILRNMKEQGGQG